jgi:hypothetical protein
VRPTPTGILGNRNVPPTMPGWRIHTVFLA